MPTFNIPCDLCAEKRAEFEAQGFVVSGCDPHPTLAKMCVLQFDEPAAPAVAPASGRRAGASSTRRAVAGPSSTAAAPSPARAAVRRLVDVEALNLRDSPDSTSSSNVKATLHLGQGVELTGEAQDGWLPVVVADGGARGFVKAALAASSSTGGIGLPSLRVPSSDAREALVAEAVRQWRRFAFGQGKETVDPFFAFVGEMWAALGETLDGRDDIPWSAAAISFIVRNVADSVPTYGGFKFAKSHSTYIHDAIRRVGEPAAPFHGFRLFERKPQVGDLVARSREAPITFEFAAREASFKSHTDIIVAVHPDEVFAIGGNVSQSVSLSRYAKTAVGHLSDEKGVFAHLVNNA